MDAPADPAPASLPSIGVRAFVVAVGFPSTLEEVDDYLNRHGDVGDDEDCGLTLVEILCEDAEDEVGTRWTVPRWARPGDVVFFYATKRCRILAQRLQREIAAGAVAEPHVRRFVDHAAETLPFVAGSIFMLGRCVSAAEQGPRNDDVYWRDRHYADIADLRELDVYIDHDTMAEFMAVRRAASITPLRAAQAECLSDLVGSDALAPPWIREITFGYTREDGVTVAGWREAARDPRLRYESEEEVRSVLIDSFLREFADLVFEECDCRTGGDRLGVADYMVRIDGAWTAWEAKLTGALDVAVDQVMGYAQATSFAPRIGTDKGRRAIAPMDGGIVVDADCLAVVDVRTGAVRVRTTWADLATSSVETIRSTLKG